jgi:hypothetical protein
MSTLVTRTIQTPDGSAVAFPNGIRIGTGGAGMVNRIGVAGQQGFGVGIAPEVPAGFAKLYGTEDPASENYGNYQFSDGSVMVYIPAFFYRYGTGSNGGAINVVDIKPFSHWPSVADANAAGYALHRAFYNGGAIRQGVFVDKYLRQQQRWGGIVAQERHRHHQRAARFTQHRYLRQPHRRTSNNLAGAIAARQDARQPVLLQHPVHPRRPGPAGQRARLCGHRHHLLRLVFGQQHQLPQGQQQQCAGRRERRRHRLC